jgi:signal transduction histidine kinase
LHAEHPAASRLHTRLHTVQKETLRLREILDDFMRYAGKLEIDPKPVEVNGMLEDLVDFFTPQAQAYRVQLRLKRTQEPLVVRLDERLIKQAILNLMINATQAMPPEGGEIILAARRETPWVVLEVMDTGRGIEPEKMAKIFDAYYSTKSGGTGLGLAITRRVVQEHRGRISVNSEVGKGSVFKIELPG